MASLQPPYGEQSHPFWPDNRMIHSSAQLNQAAVVTPDYPPLEVFKFVPVEFSDRFARGEVRIGNIAGYRQLDNVRADATEGATTFAVDVHTGGKLSGSQFTALKAAGIEVPGGRNITVNIKSQVLHNDMYCFCASTSADAVNPGLGPMAIFRISNFPAFVDEVTRASPHLAHRGNLAGMVRYDDRIHALREASDFVLDPFVKPEVLSWEREARIIWTNIRRDFLTPINVQTDQAVQYIERIG